MKALWTSVFVVGLFAFGPFQAVAEAAKEAPDIFTVCTMAKGAAAQSDRNATDLEGVRNMLSKRAAATRDYLGRTVMDNGTAGAMGTREILLLNSAQDDRWASSLDAKIAAARSAADTVRMMIEPSCPSRPAGR